MDRANAGLDAAAEMAVDEDGPEQPAICEDESQRLTGLLSKLPLSYAKSSMHCL